MVFYNEKYEIAVKETVGYSTNSTDNKYYDHCINAIDEDMLGHYSSYEMEVTSFENGEKNSIIVKALPRIIDLTTMINLSKKEGSVPLGCV